MDDSSLRRLIEEIRDVRDRLRRLENGVPLQNASVTRGRLRFEGGLLQIDSGGRLVVIGSASIDGETTVNGTFVLTGSGWRIIGSGTIEGPTTVTGTFKVDGDTRITGNLGLEGDIMLTGNFSVEGGRIVADDVRIEDGKVHIGGMVLDPDIAGGVLRFPNGSRLEADDSNGGAQLIAGSSVVNVGDVTSIRKGPSSVIVSSNSVTLNAAGGGPISFIGEVVFQLADIETFPGNGLAQGVLRVTTSGRLQRADGS